MSLAGRRQGRQLNQDPLNQELLCACCCPSQHRACPSGVCPGCWGVPSRCAHPGQAGGLAWRAGAGASSERHCQLSATSLLPPSFQPRHNWLRQPHITNKRLLTTNEVLRKALGSCPAAGGGSCRSHCRRTGGMLLPAQGAPPCASSRSPQTLHTPAACAPIPKALSGGLPPPSAPPDTARTDLGLRLYRGAGQGGWGGCKAAAAAEPSPAGPLPSPCHAEWHGQRVPLIPRTGTLSPAAALPPGSAPCPAPTPRRPSDPGASLRALGAAEHGAAQPGQKRLCQGSSTALQQPAQGAHSSAGLREPRCGSGLSLPLGRFTAQPGFITWKMLTLGIFFFPDSFLICCPIKNVDL